MRKYLLSFIVIVTSLSACAQIKSTDNEPKDGYNIEIKIKNLQEGSQLILANYLGDKPYARDTAFADKHGIATFTGNDRLERGIYMVLLPGMSYFEILVTNNNFFSIETDTTKEDYYEAMKVKNSPENERFVNYNLFLGKKNLERSKAKDKETNDKIDKEVREFKDKQIADYPDDLLTHILVMMDQPRVADAPEDLNDEDKRQWQYNYYVRHYWDNVNFKEEGLVRTPGAIMQGIIDRYFDKVLSQDPDTLIKYIDVVMNEVEGTKELERYFIWYLTRKYETSKVMCHDAVFAHMAREFYCTGKAFWADSSLIEKICEKAEKIGYTTCKTKVPDLRGADMNEQYHNLYNVQAPYTVLFFWDPTCGHCKKVLPQILDLKKRMNDTIAVYAVASQGKHKEWIDYTNKHPEINDYFINTNETDRYYPWPINRQNYDIQANPVIFFLDKDKKVIAKKIDEHKLEEFIVYTMGEDGIISKDEANSRIKVLQAEAEKAEAEKVQSAE